LDKIDDVMSDYNCHKEPIKADIVQARNVLNLKQGKLERNEDYIKRVRRPVKLYEARGGDQLWGIGPTKAIKELEEKAGMIVKFKSDKNIEIFIVSNGQTEQKEELESDDKDDTVEEGEDDKLKALSKMFATLKKPKKKKKGSSKTSNATVVAAKD